MARTALACAVGLAACGEGGPLAGSASAVGTSEGAQVVGVRPLQAEGDHFVDRDGRTVILRGVNLSGDSKVPPFLPIEEPGDLDPLELLGMNVIRLIFNWEAFESIRGSFDEEYLDAMVQVAHDADARGMFVIVDIHQDGFSRYSAHGCGDGFPSWAMSRFARRHDPDNGPDCANWFAKMILDPGMHRSFDDFYANQRGVRDAYLAMLGRVAEAFAPVPSVIGYEPINEPWGDEETQLAPLYEDATLAIRAHDPEAIVFLEGNVATNGGVIPTRLPRPTFDNFVYAPHFYHWGTALTGRWNGLRGVIARPLQKMRTQAAEWGVPMLLSEFGLAATADDARGYVRTVYEVLDEVMSSGTQWNYTPGWTPEGKDGWNSEDFSIYDDLGQPRATNVRRSYPRAVAGTATSFESDGRGNLTLQWEHVAGIGSTEIAWPFDADERSPSLLVSAGLDCSVNGRVIACSSEQDGPAILTVTTVE